MRALQAVIVAAVLSGCATWRALDLADAQRHGPCGWLCDREARGVQTVATYTGDGVCVCGVLRISPFTPVDEHSEIEEIDLRELRRTRMPPVIHWR